MINGDDKVLSHSETAPLKPEIGVSIAFNIFNTLKNKKIVKRLERMVRNDK